MIVRIATEDQYELAEDQLGPVNELDNQIVEAVEAGDEARYRELFDKLLELVRSGTKIADDDLRESQVIIPPSDTSLEEAKADFTGEGVIPDSVLPGSA